MKKLISLLLILTVMSTFVACKNNDAQNDGTKTGTEQVSGENKAGENKAGEKADEKNKDGKTAEQSGETTQEPAAEPEPEVVHVVTEEDLPEELEPTEEVNEEDGSVSVKESLLGVWKSPDGKQQLEFFEGMVNLTVGEMGADGQYAIDMDKNIIYVELLLKDGMIKNSFPFTFEDGKLRIFKEAGGDEFVKQ